MGLGAPNHEPSTTYSVKAAPLFLGFLEAMPRPDEAAWNSSGHRVRILFFFIKN